MRWISAVCVAAALALTFAACGGGDGGGSTPPTTPTPPPPGGSSATITIGPNGVSPSSVTIPVNGRVTFTNNDSQAHQISSDPHPTHTDCPPINDLGTLQAGQSRDTGAFPTARACGFHDHLNPNDASLRGTITIQ
jgi:plastocyanin